MADTSQAPQPTRDCIIVGGGPAGMIAGALLARAGLRVTVLERHADFLQDFRGDTVHPATMRIFDELGWLEAFLTIPHERAPTLHAEVAGQQVILADFRSLRGVPPYIAFMAQWDLLDFVARKASAFPGFELRMGVAVTGLSFTQEGRVNGVQIETKDGGAETLLAQLVIGADGRNSRVRAALGLEVIDFGSMVDVLWMRLPREPGDAVPAMSHAGPGQGLVLIDRGSYWQCGRVIGKGRFEALKAEGLAAFKDQLAAMAPLPRARFEALKTWQDVHLLSVRMDRLKRWWVPGALLIGDAAHAMSPIGGFGINLAVQDAVACARLLAPPLHAGRVRDADLAAVEARRRFPTHATQRLQLMMRRKRTREGATQGGPPKVLRLIAKVPGLPKLMGRLIGLGFRPEHVDPM